MADTGQAPGTNGTHVAAPDAAAPAKLTRAQRDEAERAAFLAASDADIDADVGEIEPPKKPAPKAKPAPEPEPDEVDDDTDAVDEDADLEDDLEDLDESVDEAEEEAEKVATGKDDPELAKRLAQVQKREKRVREQAEQRDKAFIAQRDAFVAEWKPKIEAAENFEKLKGRRSDPVAILKAVGYADDDLEDVSKIVYGHSKAAASDPKNKEAVARLQRDRELRDELSETKKRQAALEEKLAKAENAAMQSAEAERYMGRVTKAIGEATPLIKKRLELKPNGTKVALHRIAIELHEKSNGQPVDPKKVVTVYEKRLRAARDLARQLGDDAPTAPAAKPVAKTVPKPPAIKVIDKTAAAPTDKPTNGNGANTLLPSKADMIERLRKIDRGELDPDAD